MGAPPGAESSDLSEWPRSVCNAAALTARRTPGTATVQRIDKGNVQRDQAPQTFIVQCTMTAFKCAHYIKITKKP